MKIYLASRYSRRKELCEYRFQLQSIGYAVQSRWLNGDHQISIDGMPISEDGEAIVEGDSNCAEAAEMRSRFARDD